MELRLIDDRDPQNMFEWPIPEARRLQMSYNPKTDLYGVLWVGENGEPLGVVSHKEEPLQTSKTWAAIHMTALTYRTGTPHMGDEVREHVSEKVA